MDSLWLVLVVVGGYMAVLATISILARRASRTSQGYTTGGRVFPAVLIGFLLASEFIGTSASVGTAQAGYEVGISAAWNLASLGIGFVLFSLLLARKFKALGENTISVALARYYGERTRLATSVIMVSALLIVCVSLYTSGGAVIAGLIGIDNSVAIVITGVLAVAWVSIGGMRSVVYTNVLHAVVKLIGITLAAVVSLWVVGGMGELRASVPPEMFVWDNVGWSQIFAWLIAGIGATFATQYVVQAITTVGDEQKARRASFYSALVMVPFGLIAAFVGLCAAALYPDIDSLQALPAIVHDMPPIFGAVVVCGLTGAMLGSIGAVTLGTSTLLLKDFYQPYFNKERNDRKDLWFIRTATVVAGLLPITLALFAEDILAVTFLGKSLRAALAVLVLMMFYAPRFGGRNGAFLSIIASLLATIGWFAAGDPFGIDNAYIAVLTPLVVMTISHLVDRNRPRGTPAPSQADAPAHS
ncbi:MAG: sodium:solute symporter family protein [Streptosporangiales bacterium]|nr:sodium:solute symporter family protein [Streptosporangiales bacterium]